MSVREFYSDSAMPLFYQEWANNSGKEPLSSKKVRIAITEKCNFACPFCYNEGMSNISKILSVGDIRLIAEAISPYVSGLKIVGGEPLLHPQFGEVVELCSKTCSTTVTTNGFFLDRWTKYLERLTGITVSIQSLNPEIYRSLMGTRFGPEVVLRQISLFTEKTEIPVSVNCVLTNENSPSILNFIEEIVSCGANAVNLLGLLCITDKDKEGYYPLTSIVAILTDKYGQPEVVSSTRLRFRIKESVHTDVVYQFCMVGCGVCRTDGFIRFDPTPAISYCLASGPISIKEEIDSKDPLKIRQLFLRAVNQMGQPTGYKYQVVSRRPDSKGIYSLL